MTQRDRLVARIRARPPTALFRDVKQLLVDFGWQETRQKGSHVSFTKAGEGTITVPILDGRRVKRVYLDLICERLGLDD